MGLILPALALGVVAWVVPQALARGWPEGVGPLLALGFVATLIMVALAAALFLVLYLWAGAPLAAFPFWGAVWHFTRLGLGAGLIWAPVLILSVANLPRKWKRVVW
jgi:hypothetical protein